MKMIFEKIRERLQKKSFVDYEEYYTDNGECLISISEAIDIINQVEVEYNNGWIPCSERLPEDMQKCLVTARIYFTPDHVDETDNYIGVDFNTYSSRFGWLGGNEVIAWQPLPEPYTPKGE